MVDPEEGTSDAILEKYPAISTILIISAGLGHGSALANETPEWMMPPDSRLTTTITPKSGQPCSTVTVNGSGYQSFPNVHISWWYDGKVVDGDYKTVVVARDRRDDNFFSLDITVPGDAPPGTNWLHITVIEDPCMGICPAIPPGALHQWESFQVGEESVASNGYCPETHGVMMTPDELKLASNTTAGSGGSDAAAGNTTRTTLPATGLGGLGVTAITFAAIGSGIMSRREQR
ncbi:MAG: hypothetical protein ACYC5A_05190 [Thermoleophilia bacterium]